MVGPDTAWRPRPLPKVILDEIARHGGRITDLELYKIIREEYKYDISLAELHKVLMALELRGFIVVNRVKREFSIMFSHDFIRGRI